MLGNDSKLAHGSLACRRNVTMTIPSFKNESSNLLEEVSDVTYLAIELQATSLMAPHRCDSGRLKCDSDSCSSWGYFLWGGQACMPLYKCQSVRRTRAMYRCNTNRDRHAMTRAKLPPISTSAALQCPHRRSHRSCEHPRGRDSHQASGSFLAVS